MAIGIYYNRITDYGCKQTGALFGDIATVTLLAPLRCRKYPVHFQIVHASAEKRSVDRPFFNFHLKDKGRLNLPEAYVFETGSNQWRMYDHWPPRNTQTQNLYIAGHGFTESAPVSKEELREYHKAMEAVIAEARRLHNAGVSIDDAVRQANFGQYADWTLSKSHRLVL